MAIITTEIGYIENYVGDKIIIWFYTVEKGRWKRLNKSTVKVTEKMRRLKIEELLTKAVVTPLGRGT